MANRRPDILPRYVVRRCDDGDTIRDGKGWSWDVIELPGERVVATFATRREARREAAKGNHLGATEVSGKALQDFERRLDNAFFGRNGNK